MVESDAWGSPWERSQKGESPCPQTIIQETGRFRYWFVLNSLPLVRSVDTFKAMSSHINEAGLKAMVIGAGKLFPALLPSPSVNTDKHRPGSSGLLVAQALLKAWQSTDALHLYYLMPTRRPDCQPSYLNKMPESTQDHGTGISASTGHNRPWRVVCPLMYSTRFRARRSRST